MPNDRLFLFPYSFTPKRANATPQFLPTMNYRCFISIGLLKPLFSYAILVGMLPVTDLLADESGDAQSGPSFALEVRPILSDNCFLCHGPDEGTREAEVRFDTADGIADAFAGGDLESSEAWRRINSDDPDERMPPPESGDQLSDADMATLQAWMENGATWSGHWSFQPLQSSEPPSSGDWGTSVIDGYIKAKLDQASVNPAPRATKEVLLRRLSFDLNGLPPTIQELDAFLADKTADAYEKNVDRLLASPHFGERVAAVWLDAARYSDTFGYQRDEDRFVWPWRDWVVRAINDNMPYDEFVRQQLAGDLVERANDQTILATTFNRLHGQNSEGGSIEEEFRAEYIADRTQTFGSALLGLTMECCKCHDHKYDPLSQKDFYSMSAFFDKIDEAGLNSYFTGATPPPTLRLIDDATRNKLSLKQNEIARAKTRFQEVIEQEHSAFLAGELANMPQLVEMPKADLSFDFEGKIKAANLQIEGKVGKAVRLTGDDEIKVGKGFAFDRADSFSFGLWIRPNKIYDRAVIFHRSRAWTDSASRGYELLIEDGKLSAALIHFWPGNAIRVQHTEQLPVDTWTHVAVTYDGSSHAAGLRLFVNGELANTEIIRDNLTKTAVSTNVKEVAIGARFRDRGFTDGAVDEFNIFERQLSSAEIAVLAEPSSSSVPLSSFSDEQQAEHFLINHSESYRQANEDLRKHRRELHKIEDGIQEIMVMRDFAQAPPTHIRVRGLYNQLGSIVEPAVPEVLPPLADNEPRNRLALANWVASPDNPLSSRVAVNRIWQMVFGQGLVRTPEDFGAQGEPPTHPKLLDHLASQFVADGWNVKELIKQLVMSETYRQSSAASAATYSADPENRLWSRASRRRWPAEMLRDNALKTSGLLVDRLGGPPVKPYEIQASFVPTKPDKGEGLYRRSLYTYFKRSAPAPVMAAFDAPDRSVCRVKRERTKSPLQALVLLNGPQFVEAARVLAENATAANNDDASTIEYLFRVLTSQKPSPAERNVLVELLRSQRKQFQQEQDRALALLSIGDQPTNSELNQADVAATTIVAQTIMSFDKCVTRQ